LGAAMAARLYEGRTHLLGHEGTMMTNRRLGWTSLFSAAVLTCATAISIRGAGAWATVATFSGPGSKAQDTAPFAIAGGKVRFLFTVQPNSSGPVPFLAQMFPKGAP